MSDEAAKVSLGRLLAAVGVVLIVSVSAVVGTLLAPFRFDGTPEPSRVGALPAANVGEGIAGDLSRASRFYGELSRLDPDLRHRQTAAEAEFRLGEYFENADPIRALDHFKTCSDFLPDYRHGWPWFKMGSLLAGLSRASEATDRFGQVMKIDDGRLALLAGYECGKIAIRNSKPDQAWDFFYMFLRFYPLPIEDFRFQNMLGDGAVPIGLGLYVVGRSLLALGKTQEARPLLERYIQEFPEDASGRFYAARAGLDVRKPDSVGADLLRTDPRLSAGVRIDSGGAVFSASGRLMFDVYLDERETSVCLQVIAERKTTDPDLILTILANAEPIPESRIQIPQQPESRWKRCFSLHEGHNVLELAVQSFPVTPDRSTPILRVPSLLLLPGEAL